VSIYPFIEAEKAQQHSVQRACRLLEVSRAAYYQHEAGPSQRELSDATLTSRIKAVHAGSRAATGRRGCMPSWSARVIITAASASPG
jgi:hypothetical protein